MITKDMSITDIVNQYPKTPDVFRRFGMSCFGWMAARFENLEQGAQAHGLNVEELLKELNAVAE